VNTTSKSGVVVLAGVILGVIFSSCGRNGSTADEPMGIEQIISRYHSSPIGDAIDPITKSLATNSVFVGTEDVTPTKDGKIVGKLRLKTGVDNQGRNWAYAYTSRAEFDKAFPRGGPFAEMSFPDFFKVIELNGRFAGINLNSASDTSCPIPKELFERVKRILKEAKD